jgi:hypothetical protein
MTGRTLGNLGRAVAQTAGDRLSGRVAFGTFGGQMSSRMDEQAGRSPPPPEEEKKAATAGDALKGSKGKP